MAIATATSTPTPPTATAASSASPTTSGSTSLRTTTTTTTTSSSSAHWEPNPMQAWWESIAKARAAIQSLDSAVGPIPSLHESDTPAKSLLDSHEVARLLSAHLHSVASGSASDALCRWLYDTFQTSDSDLQLVVLRYVPLVAGLYLSRVVARHQHEAEEAQPLAGFEAVLMAVYAAEAKARGGRPVVINIPDLGQASLYHAPRNPLPESSLRPVVGQLAAPLEPHSAVKSTKRATIVGVVLDLFYRKIAAMPAAAKVEVCEFVQGWAGQSCGCALKLDEAAEISSSGLAQNPNPRASLIDEIGKFSIEEDEICADGCSNGGAATAVSLEAAALFDERRAKGGRIPLPWELLQPILRILGHCLLGPLNPQEVRDAASSSVRALFARVSHDLVPEAILATRSLIRLDIAARERARAVAESTTNKSNTTTPTKRKKPEVLLVSK